MRLVLSAVTAISLGVMATIAGAEVLNGKAAKRLLFSPKGSEFIITPQAFMGEADLALLNTLAGMKQFKTVLYFGAIAASPDDGLAHKATMATADHHSIEAAQQAALVECNGVREGAADCVVVAHITPKKFTVQPLQLSVSATVAFNKTYLRGKGPKAFAISPSQGRFAISKEDEAAATALAACAAEGAKDCQVVVQD